MTGLNFALFMLCGIFAVGTIGAKGRSFESLQWFFGMYTLSRRVKTIGVFFLVVELLIYFRDLLRALL